MFHIFQVDYSKSKREIKVYVFFVITENNGKGYENE